MKFPGSILGSAVLAGLVAWAPGVMLLAWHHRDLTHHVVDEVEEELEEIAEELFWTARQGVSDELEEEGWDEPLDMVEIEGESPSAFLRRYIAQIRNELRFGDELGLRLRLGLLGEAGGVESEWVPVEDLVELMEDEVPEEFHDALEGFLAPRVEARERAMAATSVSFAAISNAVDALESDEDSDIYVQVEDSGGRSLIAGLDVFPVTRFDDRTSVLRLVDGAGNEDSDESETRDGFFLVRHHPLDDGGRLWVGCRIDDSYRLLRRGAIQRNLLFGLGLPLVLLVAGWQAQPIRRFLGALVDAAQRQEGGDVDARLRVSRSRRDLGEAGAAVNRMLDQLGKTVQEVSRISDSIAHDLRTPLSRLQGQLDLLKHSSDPSGELIEGVQDEADRLLQTFNALLRIAQVESGSKKLGFRTLDYGEIVRDVAELYAPVFGEKDIALEVSVPPERVEGEGDRDLWLQALSNLVENALKYTPEGGSVRFSLRAVGQHKRIVLSDSGPGIPEAERESVFGRFYRLPQHRSERGSGLGLSLVSAVCDLHEAEIRLSGGPGLTVEVEL